MPDFSKDCTGCGICVEICPILAQFGTPDKILFDKPEAVFLCTSCHRCETVCPLHLSPVASLRDAKERLVLQNQVPASFYKVIEDAKKFSKTGHTFPFSFHGYANTVFWPGCGLPATRPDLICKIQNILSRYLREEVGLVLDCCFDPVFELGDIQTTSIVLQAINKRLHDGGVKKVITGCLNCHKLLSQHLQDIKVMFVLEVLPLEYFKQRENGPVYLHHPCPSLRWAEIRNAAQNIAHHVFQPDCSSDNKFEKNAIKVLVPMCCGAGGGLTATSPELADRFLERIIEEGKDGTIVTYCAGCHNRFLKRGVEAVHLLECLAGVEPRRSVPSPAAQWINRLILAGRVRLNIIKLLILLIIVLLIAGGFYLNSQHIFSSKTLMNLLEQYPVLAPIIFLGIYSIAPALFLPSIPITLAAGFFWGPVWGVVFSITGATIGACLPFFLSRYLLQNFFKNKVSPERWQWLQDKVNQHGWKAVAFTRLIPVFPFNLLNYLFGLTPISFAQYLWSTFVFMLPACIAFVAFGSSLGELIMRGTFKGVIIGIVIAAVAFLVPLALRPFFRKIGYK
ncbi:MAG: VTT domain-containing protein [Smithella sp.]